MGSYFLWIFTLAALPSVMAIHCYECTTKYYCLPTDCDDKVPREKYDACGKASIELEFGETNLLINKYTCAVKSRCDDIKKAIFCNETFWQDLGKVKKCDYSCCSEDKCNAGTSGMGSVEAIPFIAVFLSVLSIFIP